MFNSQKEEIGTLKKRIAELERRAYQIDILRLDRIKGFQVSILPYSNQYASLTLSQAIDLIIKYLGLEYKEGTNPSSIPPSLVKPEPPPEYLDALQYNLATGKKESKKCGTKNSRRKA